jgi:hypothetical protein
VDDICSTQYDNKLYTGLDLVPVSPVRMEMHSMYTDDKDYLDVPLIHVTCTVLPCHQQPKQCKHPH